MPVQNLEQYRERLLAMRDRMLGEVDSVVEAINEDLNPAGDVSNAPTHLADAAPENIVADIAVIETERGMLEEIQAALHRIDEGQFGRCTQCSGEIAAERIEALPYASQCIDCANSSSRSES